MPAYQTRLMNRMEVAERTVAVHLQRPAGFEFKARQHTDLTLLNPPQMDSRGAARTFPLPAPRMKMILSWQPNRAQDCMVRRRIVREPQSLDNQSTLQNSSIQLRPFSRQRPFVSQSLWDRRES